MEHDFDVIVILIMVLSATVISVITGLDLLAAFVMVGIGICVYTIGYEGGLNAGRTEKRNELMPYVRRLERRVRELELRERGYGDDGQM